MRKVQCSPRLFVLGHLPLLTAVYLGLIHLTYFMAPLRRGVQPRVSSLIWFVVTGFFLAWEVVIT